MNSAPRSNEAVFPLNSGVVENIPERFGDWKDLSPEQELLASNMITALADKFNRPADQFAVAVYSDEAGVRHGYVVYVDEGIDLGSPDNEKDPLRSWANVIAAPGEDRYIIDVNGERYDTRSLTFDVYKKVNKLCRHAHRPPPDGIVMFNEQDDLWTYSLLPGDTPSAGKGWLGYADMKGRAHSVEYDEKCDSVFIRFRPAVCIGQIGSEQ